YVHFLFDSVSGKFEQGPLSRRLAELASGNGPCADARTKEIVVPYLQFVGSIEDRFAVACDDLELVSHAEACETKDGTLYVRWRRAGGAWVRRGGTARSGDP